MNVKFKKLYEDVKTPTYAKEGDAGLDLYAYDEPDYDMCHYALYLEYKTGLSIEIPENYVGLIFPRSSISNFTLALCNAVGVIDSGYRGEIKFRFRFNLDEDEAITYKKGDKIGQLIIMPYPKVNLIEVNELSTTERGEGGYGSTGN